jgi:hypothetical protein
MYILIHAYDKIKHKTFIFSMEIMGSLKGAHGAGAEFGSFSPVLSVSVIM